MFLDMYEPVQTEWFKQCISAGDIFIDVGENFGHYTTLGADLVGETGKVFAFEPSPLASRVLEEMIRESSIQNIELTKAAVGKSEGTVDLFLPTTRHLHSPATRTDARQAPPVCPAGTSPTCRSDRARTRRRRRGE